MVTDRITYAQLDELLTRLGFTRRRVEPKWFCYEHAGTQTMIVLIEKKPTELVRVTDAISARRHLVEKGLISDEDFDAIVPRKATAKKA